jgi:signal transduction histidine kinase
LEADPTELNLWLSRYRECLELGRPIRFEYAAGDEDANRRWFSATVCPIAWNADPNRHCAYVCQDITDLVQARTQAEEASRAKSVFLATMSHELRTPLNSIIGFASILIKQTPENAPGKERIYLQRIRENGRHLLDLISDILDLSKIEVGHVELHSEPAHLSSIVRSVGELFEPICREKRLQFEEEGLEGDHLPLICDRGKLRQILVNLVGNAVKFTEQGSVRLRLGTDDQGMPVALEVCDSGIGIPEDQLETIFEPFRQADSSVSRKYGGSGLGLSISRSLAERMGFRLIARSHVGVGSVFRLEFNSAVNSVASIQAKPEWVAVK